MLHRRYRFEPQDHGSTPGTRPSDRGTGKAAGTIVALDDVAGIDRAQAVAELGWPHPAALMVAAPLSSSVQKQAMLRVADAVIADGIDGDGAYRAVRDCSCVSRPAATGGLGRGRWSSPARMSSMQRGGSRSSSTRNAADPGTAGHGQDLRRGADDPRPRPAPGSGSASPRSRTRRSATCSRRSSRRRPRSGSPSGSLQKADDRRRRSRSTA